MFMGKDFTRMEKEAADYHIMEGIVLSMKPLLYGKMMPAITK
jgi:hypothetical protein